MTIDVALSLGAAGAPTLARSSDGGVTWALTDLTAALGAGQVRIVAIDPTDADRVFLRVIGAGGDALAIATDGGATVDSPLAIRGRFAGRVRAHGRRDAAGRRDVVRRCRCCTVRSTTARRSRRSSARRRCWRWPRAAGTVYAATDTTLVPFAEATSTDEGDSWTPRDGVRRHRRDRALREGGLPEPTAGTGARSSSGRRRCARPTPPAADPPEPASASTHGPAARSWSARRCDAGTARCR